MRRRLWILAAAFGLGLVLAGAPSALAQSDSQGSGTDEEMAQDLKLNDDQKNQIKTINQRRKDQIKAATQDSSLTGEQKSQKVREINKTSNNQIGGLLSPEQRERYERRWRDRREDVRDRKEDRRDRREDVRDRQHDGGAKDRVEDRQDRREDKR
ncbi:MAG: hypothetical protein ACRD2R_02645, partial [Terriglobales bacterium]